MERRERSDYRITKGNMKEKELIDNELEKNRQKVLWGMCIIDSSDRVQKIEDISDDEFIAFLRERKKIRKLLFRRKDDTNLQGGDFTDFVNTMRRASFTDEQINILWEWITRINI